MKFFIITTLVAFLLSGCVPSTLVLSKDKNLILTHENQENIISSKIIDIKYDSYEYLEIIKYKLESKNSTLFFEHLEVDMDWEFKYGPIATLKYIFDGSDASIFYKDSSLSLIQLKISKDVYINILTESSAFDEMSYVYGFSNEEFKVLCKTLTNKEINLKQEAKTFTALDEHMSTWSTLMLFLEPLLKPDVQRSGDL